MRGVLPRGTLPVPAAVPGTCGPATLPTASPPSAGPRLQDHARAGRTRETATRGNGARGYAARGSATRGCTTNRTRSHRTGRPVAPAGDQDTGTGPGTAKPSVTCADRSSVTCTSSQCRHGPSGVSGFPSGWRASRAAPAYGATPCYLRGPGSSQNLLSGYSPAQAAPRTGCPAQARIAGSSRSGQGAASSSVRPTGHRVCGPWRLPGQSRARARLAGQHLGETGHGPDSCPYRQPGATSCRASRMFLITCYGLTPRCREVKR
jgi:hypothetical protein